HRHEEDLQHAEEDHRGAEQEGDEEVAAELGVGHGLGRLYPSRPWPAGCILWGRGGLKRPPRFRRSFHVKRYVEARPYDIPGSAGRDGPAGASAPAGTAPATGSP